MFMKDTDLVDIVKIVDSLKDIKKWDQWEPLRFEDLTPEQIESLTWKQWEDWPRWPVWPRWEFSDLTREQRNELTLKFSHLTEQDKDELRLRFEHLTETQIDELKLKFKHLTKEDKEELRLKFEHLTEANKKEIKWDKWEPFKFTDLTKEQKKEIEWKQWDKGDKWDDWLSAYELAKRNWFKWSEAQWLATLKGRDWKDWKSIQVTEQSLKKHKHSTWDITWLEEYVQDVIWNSLVEWTNITIDYDDITWETTINSTWWGGWASSTEITQTWHWFIQTERLYFDETDDTYKKAQSNSVDTLWAWHVVEVVDANTFKIAKEWVHEIPNTLDLWEYVLSDTVAWWYTQTLPWDLWDYVLYWMEVLSSTHISFYTVPAIPVWDTWDWVQSVVAWTWITVDNTDPLNPIINATWWGSGTVTSVAISGSDWIEIDSGSPITTAWTIALWVNKTTMLSHLNVEDWADVTDATNVGAAWAFMKATDDTDDITVGATNKFATATEKTKLWYITVTQAVDLDTMESDIAGKQPLDSDLTTIAWLTATSDNFMQAKAWAWASRTVAQVKTDLWLTWTNSWDQTTIVWITWTKADFDTAVTDGNFLYVWDISQYTDELAQDAVWAMIDWTLTYVDWTPLLQRAALTGAITASAWSNTTALGTFTTADLNTALSDNNIATGWGTATWTNTWDQNLFSTISVSWQSNVVADSTGDTLTLVAGTNVTITTDAWTDSITINASGWGWSPWGSDWQIQYNNWGSFGGIPEMTWDDTTKQFALVTALDWSLINLLCQNTAEDQYSAVSMAEDSFYFATQTATNIIACSMDDTGLYFTSTAWVGFNSWDWTYNFWENTGTYNWILDFDDITANRTFTFPNASWTIALTSDIPTLWTWVATALGINVWSAWAFVTYNWALWTPSSGTLTNATWLPISGLVPSTSTALWVGSIELWHASDTTLSRSSAWVLAVEWVVVPTVSSTNTLTNKRITDRVWTVASSATPTINTDDVDAYSITALATAITSMTTNLSWTPTDFQKLLIRIKDNGTARAITWGASFEAKGVALPTTTVISKVLTVWFVYDTVSAKWGCIASAQEA